METITDNERLILLDLLKAFFKKHEISLRNGEKTLVLSKEDVQNLENLIKQSGTSSNLIKGSGTSSNPKIILDLDVIEQSLANLYSLQLQSEECLSTRSVNISTFSNLKHLKLIKTSPHFLSDIDCLRPQLKGVLCYKSIAAMKDLLRCKDDTFGMSSFWSELRHLDVSYNSLQHFDDSLSLLPNLECLNASHNRLESCEGAKLLKHILRLNLSYNSLKCFPSLSAATCTSLKILVLKYNFLENLKGLEYLVYLEELDLSYNCLMSHEALEPIRQLYILSDLNLLGNPIVCNSKHRLLTANHVHPNAFQRGFLLDKTKLTRKEFKFSHQGLTKINFDPTGHSSLEPTLFEPPIMVPSMLGSLNFNDDLEESPSSVIQLMVPPAAATGGAISKKTRITKKREIVIADHSEQKTNSEIDIQMSTSVEVPVNASHMETKTLIEEKRREHGSGWLLSASGILSRPILKLSQSPQSSQLSDTESANPQFTVNLTARHPPLNVKASFPDQNSPGTSLLEDENTILASSATESVEEAVLTLPRSIFNQLELKEDKEDEEESDSKSVSASHSGSSKSERSFSEDSEDSEEEEDESSCFIVQRDTSLEEEEEFFLIIGKEYFFEKDSLSGKLFYKWSLNSLISAQIIQNENGVHFVEIEFNPSKIEKAKRGYKMESLDSAKSLLALLNNNILAKGLKLATDGALECIKCSSEFSREVANRAILKDTKLKNDYLQEVNACPNCGSTMLIESRNGKIRNEEDETDSKMLSVSATSSNFKIQDYFRSTGNTKSDEDSGSIKKISKNRPRSISSEVRNQRKAMSLSPAGCVVVGGKPGSNEDSSSSSVDCISLNNQEEEEDDDNPFSSRRRLVLETSEVSVRKSESEVTILSNPSQSSIAIISANSSLNLGETIGPAPTALSLGIILEHEQMCNVHSVSVYDSADSKQSKDLPRKTLNNVPPTELLNSPSLKRVSSPSETQWYDSLSTQTFCIQDGGPSSIPNTVNLAKEGLEIGNETEDSNSDRIWKELEETSSSSSKIDEDFSQVDHRVRLYLEMEIFKENEELLAAIKCAIVSNGFPEYRALIIVSTLYIYIFDITKGTDENVGSYLQSFSGGHFSSVLKLSTLLGSQGFVLTFSDKTFFILLHDADLCNSFVAHLKEIFETKRINVEFELCAKNTLQDLRQQLLVSKYNSHLEVTLFILAYWRRGDKVSEMTTLPVAVVINSDTLSIAQVKYTSNQNQEFGIHFSLLEKQNISNLTLLHINETLESCSLHFLDEDNGTECFWILNVSSRSSMSSLLTSIKTPWEKTFQIKLQIYDLKSCFCKLEKSKSISNQ